MWDPLLFYKAKHDTLLLSCGQDSIQISFNTHKRKRHMLESYGVKIIPFDE